MKEFLQNKDETLFAVVTVLIALISLITTFISYHSYKKQEIQASIRANEIFGTLKDDNDILKLLYKNVKETTEYYVISKKQASRSFTIAIMSCVAGFMFYLFGFVLIYIKGSDISILAVVSGTVSELVSGLSFWMYKKSTEQLSEYHKRLNSTERYLTAITLVGKMSPNQHDKNYEWIIQNSLITDNEIQTGKPANR
jgi:hypothetical protein